MGTDTQLGVLGLRSKGLVAEGAAWVASIRRDKKLPPVRYGPVLSVSKRDLLLAGANPLSYICHASVKADVRTENAAQQQLGE